MCIRAASAFEAGVKKYFDDFGHRRARESAHQAWLFASVTRFINPQLVAAELNVRKQDLCRFANIADSAGAMAFDFAITREEIDLRTWKARTPGWRAGALTAPQTLQTLEQVQVLAEFKIAASTSTNVAALVTDLEKLRAAIGFLAHHGCKSFPSCYLVVLNNPDWVLDVKRAKEFVVPNWPNYAAFPKVLVGP